MKKYILLLSLAFAIKTVYAQGGVDTTIFQGKADYYLQYVDKAQIPTQILYDRVFPLARLDAFNQGTSDTSSYGHFMQALSELRNASYSTTNVPVSSDLEALTTEQRLINKVPISIAHYQYNWIDTLALQNNLLKIQNGLLYDVVGRPYSPYKTKITTIGAVLSDSVSAGSIAFTLPTYFVLKNTAEALTNVDITFGDGNPVTTLTPGGTVTVNYSNPGNKIIRFLARFSNGTQQITYCYLSVTPVSTSNTSLRRPQGTESSSPCVITNVRAAIPFQGYDETIASKGEDQVNTYYANCADPRLLKPIIILDGFDPGDTRGASKIYTDYLSYTDNNGTPQHLVENFKNQGYDIIILNFPKYVIGSHTNPIFPGINIPDYRDGGADYMERNAFVLARLIDSVNAKLVANGSIQKLVIIGPSMGGLISRYALAYMQQHSIPSNTKLWISFDAPHNGANIPIADQHFLEYLATKVGGNSAKKALNEQINSPAARQLLLNHYSANSETPVGAPNFRSRFQTAMNTIGFPGIPGNPALRRVAIVNGSGNGSRQVALGLGRNIIPCEKMFTTEIRLSKGIRTLFFLSSYFFPPLIALSAPITISAAKPYFTPQTSNRCLSFEGTFVGYSSKTWYSTALNSGAGLDESPGGYYSTQKILADEGKETNFFALSQVKFYSVIPNHCFIPTKSALAFMGTNTDLSENLSGRNLICAGETPFQSYFTPTTNENHVSLSQASVTWITNEINGIPQPPSFNYATAYPIQLTTGSEPICTSAVYQVANLPSGSSVTWTSSNSNIATVPPIGNPVTVTRIGNGAVTLTASVSACGSNFAVTKNITVGPLVSTKITADPASGSGSMQGIQFYYNGIIYHNPFSDEYLEFQSLDGHIIYPHPPNELGSNPPYEAKGSGIIVDVKSANNSSIYLAARMHNLCGYSDWRYFTIPLNSVYGYYIISPNPASGTITVQEKEQENSRNTIQAGVTEIRIFDNVGNLKKQSNFSLGAKQVQINVSDLIAGVYFVEISDGRNKARQQLIIQR